jgi:dTDP-4-amino-4,6-dideoxygalactose transaminase
VTNNDELAKKMRLMKNFGFAGYDNVIYPGTNGKMCEASAAMGLTGLESFDTFVDTNRRNHAAYREGLAGIPGVTLMSYDARERSNYQYVVTEIDESQAGISRDMLVDLLWAENVLARRYFYPGIHRMEPYRSYFPHANLLLPETERLSQRVMILPTGTAVDAETIQRICGLILFAIANAEQLRKRLPR